VIADLDGVLIVPKADILAVLARAAEIVGIERQVRDDMRLGMSPLEGLAKHGHT